MYDRRGREMYYADEIQVDPRTVSGVDMFRVDSERVFGVVVCLGHGNIKNDRQLTLLHKSKGKMSSTEPKPRPIKLEAHVLAYLGDFMNIFEESIRRKALREIHTMPKPTTGTQKPREPPPSSR